MHPGKKGRVLGSWAMERVTPHMAVFDLPASIASANPNDASLSPPWICSFTTSSLSVIISGTTKSTGETMIVPQMP